MNDTASLPEDSLSDLDPELIASIYSAATEPDGLRAMVDIVRTHVDVDSAGIWMLKGADIFSMVQTPDIAESIGPYLDYYARLDPWAPQPPGKVSLGNELYDEELLLRSEFYNDFAKNYGMLRPMGVALDLGDGVLAKVATNRTEGGTLLGEADKHRLAALGVHLVGALRLHQRLHAARSQADLLARSLDALALACVTCQGDGTIRHVNAAAAGLLAEDAGLRIAGKAGRLAGPTSLGTQQIDALVLAASRGVPGALRLKRRGGGMLSLLATPLSRVPTGDLGEAVLVTVTREDAAGGPDAAVLQRVFSLSPAQATLAHQLSRGMTFEAAAAERGIALSTARTHFLAILRKSETTNLRDLLRLIATLPKLAVTCLAGLAHALEGSLPLLAAI